MNIREFRPGDTDALYQICLRTVDAGNDGTLLLSTLFAALQEAGSTGIFLGVPPANSRAIGFYHRMGLAEIPNLPPHRSIRLGKAFAPAGAADA